MKIGRVTVNDRPELLTLSSRLGYNTVEPAFMTCSVVCAIWAVSCALIVQEDWIPWVAAAPAAFAVLVLALMSLFDRTRVSVTAAGLQWGTGPIPAPGHPFGKSLRRDQISAVFVGPKAISNRYSATFIHSWEVLVLTVDGEVHRVLSRIKPVSAARELAGLVGKRLALDPARPNPPLSILSRSVVEGRSLLPMGVSATPFCVAAILFGLLVFVGPWLRILGKVAVVGKIEAVDNGPLCSVSYEAADGPHLARVSDDCPASARKGDKLPIYYDRERPRRVVKRQYALQPIGLVFLLPGVAGSIYLARRRPRPVLDQDSFRRLDGFWDLTPDKATASKGVLKLTGPPGTTLTPVHYEQAFASPTIDVRVIIEFGNSSRLAAGILFWADGLGDGYVFSVVPGFGGVDAWRIVSGKFEKVLPFVRVPQVTTAWNTLQVVTQGRRALLYVNGAAAGVVDGVPPPGGSMVGLFASFPADTNSSWQFSEFRVTQS